MRFAKITLNSKLMELAKLFPLPTSTDHARPLINLIPLITAPPVMVLPTSEKWKWILLLLPMLLRKSENVFVKPDMLMLLLAQL